MHERASTYGGNPYVLLPVVPGHVDADSLVVIHALDHTVLALEENAMLLFDASVLRCIGYIWSTS